MEKVFNFLEGLKPEFYEMFGYPTIKVYSDYAEVYFDSTAVVHYLTTLQLATDGFRMFPDNGRITFVFTFDFSDKD